MNRREFLTHASSTLIVAPLATRARGSEPIARASGPKFKFSLAAYSYRELLKGKNATLTLHDFIDDCAAMQLDGTELTSYYFPEPLTADAIRSLKSHAFRLGLDVSGTAVGNDFGHPDGDARSEQIAHVKTWIDYADLLDAPVIRIFAGQQKEGVPEKETHALMVAGIQECCDYASKHGVYLALENHGGPTATAAGLLRLVRDVESPAFGVNLDTGNFHSDDVYAEIAEVAPYALNVQVKVAVSGPDRKKHPSDYRRLAQILRESGYRGYIVLEYEEGGDPRQECRKHLDAMREAFS